MQKQLLEKCLIKTSRGDFYVYEDVAKKVSEILDRERSKRPEYMTISGRKLKTMFISEVLTLEATKDELRKQQGYFRCPNCKDYFRRGELCSCETEKQRNKYGKDNDNTKKCREKLDEGSHLWVQVGTGKIFYSKNMTEEEQKDFLLENSKRLNVKKIETKWLDLKINKLYQHENR